VIGGAVVGTSWSVRTRVLGHRADEIAEQTVGGGDYAGLVLDDGEAEDIHIETQGGGGAFERGERIGGGQLFRADADAHAACGTLRATD